jgi:hypothetical protein
MVSIPSDLILLNWGRSGRMKKDRIGFLFFFRERAAG